MDGEEKEKEYRPALIISDEPSKESSSFRFDAYANTISNLIAYRENKTPLVIGIYGAWGSGKTTLMKKVQEQLSTFPKGKDREKQRPCKTVWFQAWKYSEEDAILAALVEEIFRTMERDDFFNKAKGELEKLVKKLDKGKVLSSLSKAITGGSFDVTEFFGELEHKDKLGFYATFEQLFADLIWTYVRDRPKLKKNEKVDDKEGVLVVFIDDLDRCPKDRIPKVLETIKLFMDQPGCVFIIGAAKEIIESAIVTRQGHVDEEDEKEARTRWQDEADLFMQKIVQVTFDLPGKSVEDIESYIETLVPDQPLLQQRSKTISEALGHNPRAVKRFLNNLSLRKSLVSELALEKVEPEILEDAMVRWAVMEIAWHGFVERVRKDREAMKKTQDFVQGVLDAKKATLENWRLNDEDLKDLDEGLHRYVRIKGFVELVRDFPVEDEVMRAVVELSEVVGEVEVPSSKREGRDYNPDAMVMIPAGAFLYGEEKEEKFISKDYQIDVYPVTNERYRRFIEANGYENKEVWSDDGWKWKENKKIQPKKIIQPRLWNHEKWNQPDHPVVGVSWYEAEAFAKWEGKRLPTEQEWEKAARGEGGQEYPWKGDFDSEKCNSDDGIGRTTPVTRYLNGLSPYGCFDMAGNVWEWQSDWYDSDKDFKVLRGGSWLNYPVHMRTDFRSRYEPNLQNNAVGFRCVQ